MFTLRCLFPRALRMRLALIGWGSTVVPMSTGVGGFARDVRDILDESDGLGHGVVAAEDSGSRGLKVKARSCVEMQWCWNPWWRAWCCGVSNSRVCRTPRPGRRSGSQGKARSMGGSGEEWYVDARGGRWDDRYDGGSAVRGTGRGSGGLDGVYCRGCRVGGLVVVMTGRDFGIGLQAWNPVKGSYYISASKNFHAHTSNHSTRRNVLLERKLLTGYL